MKFKKKERIARARYTCYMLFFEEGTCNNHHRDNSSGVALTCMYLLFIKARSILSVGTSAYPTHVGVMKMLMCIYEKAIAEKCGEMQCQLNSRNDKLPCHMYNHENHRINLFQSASPSTYQIGHRTRHALKYARWPAPCGRVARRREISSRWRRITVM